MAALVFHVHNFNVHYGWVTPDGGLRDNGPNPDESSALSRSSEPRPQPILTSLPIPDLPVHIRRPDW
eukprot:316697-Pyramimonas_sp.AAC.1